MILLPFLALSIFIYGFIKIRTWSWSAWLDCMDVQADQAVYRWQRLITFSSWSRIRVNSQSCTFLSVMRYSVFRPVLLLKLNCLYKYSIKQSSSSVCRKKMYALFLININMNSLGLFPVSLFGQSCSSNCQI